MPPTVPLTYPQGHEMIPTPTLHSIKRAMLSFLLFFVAQIAVIEGRRDIFSFISPSPMETTRDGAVKLFAMHDDNDGYEKSRRSALLSCLGICTISPNLTPLLIRPASASDAPIQGMVPLQSNWISVSGLRSDLASSPSKFVSFDSSAYLAMKNDVTRTPVFDRAIKDRLAKIQGGPGNAIVLDLGTGPYAIFAISAAAAGAGKVYAIEANSEAAASAREAIAKLGYGSVITVLEGFSTAIEALPNGDLADFVVAEIIGSVASEEGCVATAVDARRFLKRPEDGASWIPERVQTYAAPASYTLHNLFGPPEFDWKKLGNEPVRFNCRDEGLQLLAEPALVEDIIFSQLTKNSDVLKKEVKFVVDDNRIQQNTLKFYKEYTNGNIKKPEAVERAQSTARTVSGIALWPRLLLSYSGSAKEDEDSSLIVDSRGYPDGGHRKSHWQTVLPIGSERPVPGLVGGDVINVSFEFKTPTEKVDVPPQYKVNGRVYPTGGLGDDDEIGLYKGP